MITTLVMHLGTEEICRLSQINTETIIEIVEHGIIQPEGEGQQQQQPASWRFDPQVIGIAKKAVRLHRDLDIDWAGIALAIDLLQDLDALRQENKLLRQRIERFMDC